MRDLTGACPPAEAAHSEPGLRQLYPLSSRWMLCFSGCTAFPCAVQAAVVPSQEGRYRNHPCSEPRPGKAR
ncbi:DUF6193 family natural product biosynthesis protein [Streptomyces sp. NPDC056231]|uniref:DUF6193 family natural product biosynthesis protein n=1 Tax=Streptomyces sp. NPDC056231 TaxID=3345755 RepID=UPI003AACDA4F